MPVRPPFLLRFVSGAFHPEVVLKNQEAQQDFIEVTFSFASDHKGQLSVSIGYVCDIEVRCILSCELRGAGRVNGL